MSRTDKSACSCDRHSYDVLLDEQLKPWLLEVNASPSLTCCTESDWLLKGAMLDDLLEIVAPNGHLRRWVFVFLSFQKA